MDKGWKLLDRNNLRCFELWQTPTKFLVCWKYINFFQFFNTLEKARECFQTQIQSSGFQT